MGCPASSHSFDYLWKDIAVADWDGLHGFIWEMFHGRISLNLVLLLLLVKFMSWFLGGTDVYIPHRKYHIKSHSSLRFSAAAMVHRNHFFGLYQKNKSSDSKVKFREASNHCKRVLEAAILHMLKESIIFQKLGSWNFWCIANNVLNKGKSAIPHSRGVVYCTSDKAKLFAENFPK